MDFDLTGDAGTISTDTVSSADGSCFGVVLVGRTSGLGGCSFPADVSVEASFPEPAPPTLACETSEGAVDTSGIIWIGAPGCSIA